MKSFYAGDRLSSRQRVREKWGRALLLSALSLAETMASQASIKANDTTE